MASWLPLEGNPDSINKFLTKLGVSSVEAVDVLGFDTDDLSAVPKPNYALLFVFPYIGGEYEKLKKESLEAVKAQPPEKDVYFMAQHITNACGTYALFHALANNEGRIDLGSGAFKSFLDKTKNLSPDERSKALEGNTEVAIAHVEAANVGQTEARQEKVLHHFIVYLVKNGQLYEIDSRAPGPLKLGSSSDDELLAKSAEHCKKMIDSSGGNLLFSALALVKK